MARRVAVDCSKYPGQRPCTLKMSGTEEEVLEAAVAHAVKTHSEHDTPELRSKIRAVFEEQRG